VLVEFLAIFSVNKSSKTYLRHMLLPGGRNWHGI
jgi:hypothetical protein